jgi:hypothetical protein
MTLTARKVLTELQNLLDYAITNEIAIFANPIRFSGSTVAWHPYNPSERFLLKRDASDTLEYRHWIETGEFTAMLFDGALLQISYDVAGGNLVGHRLAYVPAPFAWDQELLVTEPFVEVFDMYAAGHTSTVILNTQVRFDFDPGSAGESHPSVHLTINGADCRIACTAPVRIGQFTSFIFRNFYPTIWRSHPYFRRLPTTGWGLKTISDDEELVPHLSWRL